MLDGVVREAETGELLGIGIEYDLILTGGHEDTVVVKGLLSVPVEDEQQVATRISHHLVALVVCPLIYPRQVFADVVLLLLCGRVEGDQVLLEQMDHRLVEAVEVREEIVGVVHEVPLTTGVLTAPSVALPREIDPLRVTELVPHEIEVSAVDGRSGNETDHLMQRYSAVGHVGRMTVLEVPVHVGVHEAEDDGLVAYECLVVTLGVGDGLLVLAAVGHLIEDMTGFPVLILNLFDILDPEIGNTHGQTVVKSHAAVRYRASETRHAGHLFGDGDGIGFDLMNDLVSQREVHERIAVFVTVEVRRIAVEVLAQTVTAVDHGGHTVETEAVEVVFVEPELTVRQQEMEHFVLAVVKAERVPGRVFAATAVMEILIACSVEVTESLEFVLDRMAVHEVHDDLHTASVRVVDERFEFVRCTETAGSSEEIRYVVSERAVVRVLLDGHDLHAVIAQFLNTRQHIATELLVRVHFLLLGTHADMALVDIETVLTDFLHLGSVAVLPLVFGFIPHLCGKDLGLLILNDAAYVRRDTLSVTAVPLHEQLVHLSVLHGFAGQFGFPHAVADRLETIGFVLGPVVHVAFDIDRGGIWSPFAQYPAFGCFVQAEIEVSGRPLCQRLTAGQFFLFIDCIVVTTL